MVNLVTYLASSARAHMPAASGAEAEVPVWSSVHWLCMSVVSYKQFHTNTSSQHEKQLSNYDNYYCIYLTRKSYKSTPSKIIEKQLCSTQIFNDTINFTGTELRQTVSQ